MTHEAVGPIPDGADPAAYDRLRRRVLWSLTTGIYVLGSRSADGRRNLMTVSLVTQASTDPKTVAAAIEHGSVTGALVADGGVFALTLLDRADKALVRKFVKPVTDDDVDDAVGTGTMNGQAVELAASGAPVLASAAAWIDCRVVQRLELGSHDLVVGEVTACGAGSPLHPAGGEEAPVFEALRMEDTRMNYGG